MLVPKTIDPEPYIRKYGESYRTTIAFALATYERGQAKNRPGFVAHTDVDSFVGEIVHAARLAELRASRPMGPPPHG